MTLTGIEFAKQVYDVNASLRCKRAIIHLYKDKKTYNIFFIDNFRQAIYSIACCTSK